MGAARGFGASFTILLAPAGHFRIASMIAVLA
jgi:hypothetical protein